MIRSAAILVAAMLLSRPSMPKSEASVYAKALNEAAAKHGFDPLMAVAIVHFETQWHPTLVSPDGEDFGLGQVRARYVGACREDADPVNAPSAACAQAKEALRVGVVNIARMGTIIGANMAFCKEHTKSDAPERWLAGYQGYGDTERGKFCLPGEKTHKVMGYYKHLMATFAPPPKPAKVKKKAKTHLKSPAIKSPATKPAERPKPLPVASVKKIGGKVAQANPKGGARRAEVSKAGRAKATHKAR